MTTFRCKKCSFIYDEYQGDSKNGVPPKTTFDQLAHSVCKTCGMRNMKQYDQKKSEYKGLEAECYSYFCGKANIQPMIDYLGINVNHDKRILEVGAGTGRVTKELIASGFYVDAIENSPFFVENLKKQKWANDQKLKIIEADFREYLKDRHSNYHGLLFSDGLFQELYTFDQAINALKKIGDLLLDDGIIWIEFLSPNEEKVAFSRSKYLDSDTELSLNVSGEKRAQYWQYTSTIEQFNNGYSKKRYRVSRSLFMAKIEALIHCLPDDLTFVKSLFVTKRGKKRLSEETFIWEDGGYPFPSSYPLIERKYIILKKGAKK